MATGAGSMEPQGGAWLTWSASANLHIGGRRQVRSIIWECDDHMRQRIIPGCSGLCLFFRSVVIGIASHTTTRQFGLDAIDRGFGGGYFMACWWQWHGALEYFSLGLRALWLCVFMVALVVHGWRGLWLPIGAPLALTDPRT